MNINISTLTHISHTLLSDHHKDAFGFRPSQFTYDREWWTSEQLKTEHMRLSEIIRANETEEARSQARCLVMHVDHLTGLMQEHNVDRATALRWDFEAEMAWADHRIDDHRDLESYYYHKGLSWATIAELTSHLTSGDTL
jgi:hypothetical protein